MNTPEPETGTDTRASAEIIANLTSADIVADGYTTMDDVRADMRARGIDPHKYDYLYD